MKTIMQNVWHTLRLLLLLIPALVCQNTLAQDKYTVLRINNTNSPPYSTLDGMGFTDKIANEAFHRIGVKLKLVVLPAERGLINANAGIIDGDLTRIKGLEYRYPNLRRVPEKIMDWEFQAFSKDPKAEATIEKIRQHPVAIIRGWKIYEDYLKGAKYVTLVDNPVQLFRLLEKGRVKYVLYEHWLGLAMLHNMHIKDVATLKPLIAKREMYVYLNKHVSQHINPLSEALKNLKRDGYYDKIYRQVLTPYTHMSIR